MRTIDLTDGCSETRILVTGGAGFIGTRLCDLLLGNGYAVDALDNLSTGNTRNVDYLSGYPGFTFYQGSVLDELIVDMLAHKNDIVVHLAGAVGVRMIMDEPLRSFRTNIRGATIVLDAAHRYRRKVFLASTSEIYGKNPCSFLSESSDRILGSPSVTRWSYSTSKAVAEIMAFAYHKERGLPVVIGRFFNAVGPGQIAGSGMVIPRFVQQALAGQPLTVYGDGSQVRCFCHVDDVVEAIEGLIFEPSAVGQAFNVGTSEEVTILELATLVIEMTGNGSGITFVPYEAAFGDGFEDLPHRRPDATQISDLLGWKPKRDLRLILEDVIEQQQALAADRTTSRS